MPCTNCFNGCTDTQSDKCVKYTGPTISELEITTGDTLLSVENKITEYLLTALDGTGIIPYINPTSLCALVSSYLPVSGPITLVNIVDALIKSICDLNVQVTSLNSTINTLNGTYTVGCLTGVTGSSGTHDILQATITQVCAVNASVIAMALDLTTNYVAIADINSYIAEYLSTTGTSTAMSNKMVPYAVVEYYGSLSYFDATGAGTGDWEKIYLCNGLNGTPDKRGRVAVGATTGMGGGVMSPIVDPAVSGNPNYALGTIAGVNNITLLVSQMPSHTHIATVNDPGHLHNSVDHGFQANRVNCDGACDSFPQDTTPSTLPTSVAVTGITVSNAANGGGESHLNIQPSLGCYYIQYRP